jgi:hypothetical protein
MLRDATLLLHWGLPRKLVVILRMLTGQRNYKVLLLASRIECLPALGGGARAPTTTTLLLEGPGIEVYIGSDSE